MQANRNFVYHDNDPLDVKKKEKELLSEEEDEHKKGSNEII